MAITQRKRGKSCSLKAFSSPTLFPFPPAYFSFPIVQKPYSSQYCSSSNYQHSPVESAVTLKKEEVTTLKLRAQSVSLQLDHRTPSITLFPCIPHPPITQYPTPRQQTRYPIPMTHAINWADLTFGIELEMVCSVKYSEGEDPISEFDSVRETILSQLRSVAGVRAQLVHKSGNEGELPIIYYSEDGLFEEDDDSPDYTVWGVQFDNSVEYSLGDIHDMYPELPHLARYNGQDRIAMARPGCEMVYHNPVEVVSRVLRIADVRTWGREIPRMLGSIACNRLRPFVTDTAGYHVHIGLGDHCFPLETVKKIGAVVVLAERTIDLFHEEHRRDNKKNIAPLITKEGLKSLTRKEIFDQIMGTNDLDEFLDVVNGRRVNWNEMGDKEELIVRWRYYKVNFTYLQPDDPKGTIEFRQHAATLDYVEIQMWIRFLGLLVVHASAMDVKVLRNILVSSANKGGIIPPIGFICSFIRDEPVARYYLDKIGVKLIVVR